MWVTKKTIIHERNECIGCGSCVLIAPHQRHMNHDDGKSCLKGATRKGNKYMVGQIDEDDTDINREVADACPVSIIRVST